MPPKYRIVHRYGKWHVVEYTPKKDYWGKTTYTSRTVVQPTTKKLAEGFMKLLKEEV